MISKEQSSRKNQKEFKKRTNLSLKGFLIHRWCWELFCWWLWKISPWRSTMKTFTRFWTRLKEAQISVWSFSWKRRYKISMSLSSKRFLDFKKDASKTRGKKLFETEIEKIMIKIEFKNMQTLEIKKEKRSFKKYRKFQRNDFKQ